MDIPGMVVPAILVSALVPSIFPTWRSTFIAAGVIYGLLAGAFLLSLREVDAMTTGEGPAFSGIILLYGAATTVLASSCFIKAAIAFVLSCLRPAVALWLRRILVCICLLVFAVSVYAALGFHVNRKFAALVSVVFLWLSLIMLMLHSPFLRTAALRVARPDSDKTERLQSFKPEASMFSRNLNLFIPYWALFSHVTGSLFGAVISMVLAVLSGKISNIHVFSSVIWYFVSFMFFVWVWWKFGLAPRSYKPTGVRRAKIGHWIVAIANVLSIVAFVLGLFFIYAFGVTGNVNALFLLLLSAVPVCFITWIVGLVLIWSAYAPS